MPTVIDTVVQLELAFDGAMKRKRPVFIWGPPGIGKYEVVE